MKGQLKETNNMISLVTPGEGAGQWTLKELPASTDVESLIQIFIKCCCAIWNQIQNFGQREREREGGGQQNSNIVGPFLQM